ncbi:DnaJ domain-containing protein [Prevotella veroralis]|uniref:DnaJ domain-containing protein n=1 Tax=Prevotella veroralis TaxID=28137 RepID=UPI000380C82E|nr:DnaJ domain-containing protein [Prevotella veroralis]
MGNMKWFGSWIGGTLGTMLGSGILGTLAGFCLGSIIDEVMDSRADSNNYNANNQDHYSQGNGYQQYQYGWQNGTPNAQTYEEQRNSFLFSMLVLSSYIIKADGKIMHSEMEFVRQFLRQNFGEQAVNQGQEILLKLFEVQKQQGEQEFRKTIHQSCTEIKHYMDVSQRLQLLNYLVIIAKVDGYVSPEEIKALKEVARHLGLTAKDIDSMLNMESGARADSNIEDAYKVLGISPTATDDEVKAAYRKMALKHHPDRVATLGEDIRKAAEKKFQDINDAKERIFKARGL